MIQNVNLKCVLDTNVIYPLWTRDLLLWFAFYDLYIPYWSNSIFSEWIRVMKRKGIDEQEAIRRANIMNMAFPAAQVKNYKSLLGGLSLPDKDDRHVLAVTLKIKADIIITHNLKDFPKEYLLSFGIKAKSPDDFFMDIIDLNPELSILAFKKLVFNKKNPSFSEIEVLEILKKNSLSKTAEIFKTLL